MKLKNSLVFLNNVIASNLRIKRRPYKLTFAVTYKCNSKCLTCNIWQRESKNELSFEEIDSFFQKNPYFQWIDLTGGEIFTRNDVVDIIGSIKKNCKNLYSLHFPTNGILTDRIVDAVKEAEKMNVNKLIVSLSIDGPPEIHDKIRNVEGGFEKVIATYKRLREIESCEVYAGMTISEHNVDKFQETFDAIKERVPEFAYRDLHVNIAHSSSHYYGNSIDDYPSEKAAGLIKEYIKLRKLSLVDPVAFMEYQYLRRVGGYLSTGKSPMSCHSMTVSMFLDPHGNVFPCCIYDKKVGNIRDNDLEEIWEAAERKTLAKEINKLKCPQCWTPCEAYQTILANRGGI